jgi:hypothetical protein
MSLADHLLLYASSSLPPKFKNAAKKNFPHHNSRIAAFVPKLGSEICIGEKNGFILDHLKK